MPDDFIFHDDLTTLDSAVQNIIARETARQKASIILIASESETPSAVHEANASSFGHIYAEGYPREASRRQTEAQILDLDYELALYRRNSDPRYYKGVEYADIIEALARRRAAELFAANGVKPSGLYVNVQTLSGGPANSAIYHAIIKEGDTIMGLKLSDGGHLSHGAPVNRSGLSYRSVSYRVDPKTEALDYDAIEALAIKEKPDVIVAGYSAYPKIIDWLRFREIADKVGALMVADIAHISGLVAAGVHPSPIGIADVITTTTHKSLCGPRGAMLMTHRRDIARKIDKAVFPGEQGGPHVNTIAALAVALKLATTDKFKQLQRLVVRNSARLAARLQEYGLRVVGGGSENHLMLVDCKSIRVNGVPLTGDIASRILDVAGIVLNRNNIPGDKSALNPFGVRIGTVWVSQRGFGDAEIDLLAEAIATAMKGITPFYYRGKRGKQFRAKIAPAALAKTRAIVRQLTNTAVEVDENSLAVEVRGKYADEFLNQALSSNVWSLAVGEAQATTLSGYDIKAECTLERVAKERFLLHLADAQTAADARLWLADLSDGYVEFGDLHAKLTGPVAVTTIAAMAPKSAAASAIVSKPFYVNQATATGDALPVFEWSDAAVDGLKTALHGTHVALGAKMVPFGGWDMPVWYSSVSDEHAAVRQAAGLFDVSHMGVFEVSGKGSAEFLHNLTANDVHKLRVGRSHYTYLLDVDGAVIDDLLIYRRGAEKFMLVVNASNNDKDWAWINAVNEGKVCVDRSRPSLTMQNRVTIRDLRDLQWGDDCRVDIALQGSRSTDILLAMGCDDKLAARVRKLPWGGLAEGTIGGFDLIISRTGYTGERVAYELFVHPDKAVAFWDALMATGEPLGMKPCGLAARDSTRTEAGLPLYGHELAGQFGISPDEAGFTSFVKVWKPFFVGRDNYLQGMLNRKRNIVRFRMDEKGVRRPETGDPILDKRGKVVGHVTSCAIDADGYLLGQAIVPTAFRRRGTSFRIYQLGGGSRSLRLPKSLKTGARLPAPDSATVLSRFP